MAYTVRRAKKGAEATCTPYMQSMSISISSIIIIVGVLVISETGMLSRRCDLEGLDRDVVLGETAGKDGCAVNVLGGLAAVPGYPIRAYYEQSQDDVAFSSRCCGGPQGETGRDGSSSRFVVSRCFSCFAVPFSPTNTLIQNSHTRSNSTRIHHPVHPVHPIHQSPQTIGRRIGRCTKLARSRPLVCMGHALIGAYPAT